MDVAEIQHQNPKANSEKAGTGMNKYTIVCALLASTNSILLGYGKFIFCFLFCSFGLI